MQTSTTELIKTKAELRAMTQEARSRFNEMEAAEASVYRDVNLSNYRAWQFGKTLCVAKSKMEHGMFEGWRASTFPKLHERRARQIQELFKYNAKRNELSVINERTVREFVEELEADSLRKFRLGYFEKEKPDNPANVKFPKLNHWLKVINEFCRWERRESVGHNDQGLSNEEKAENQAEQQNDFRVVVRFFALKLYQHLVVTLPDGRRALVVEELIAEGEPTTP